MIQRLLPCTDQEMPQPLAKVTYWKACSLDNLYKISEGSKLKSAKCELNEMLPLPWRSGVTALPEN